VNPFHFQEGEHARDGWLRADPGLLDRFADEIDDLAEALERLRARQSDMASFQSPSTDPATVRATAGLAEDGHDRAGTPVHAVSRTIDDLRKQAVAARLAARDHRAGERAITEDLRRAGDDPS
jgi:hypothetical protein